MGRVVAGDLPPVVADPSDNRRFFFLSDRLYRYEVVIGGELFSDAMGPAGTYEGTYIGMIDHNVTTIARALGGQAPERGLNGKLAK